MSFTLDQIFAAGEETAPTAEELKVLGERYLTRTKIKVGDLVQWKPGLKNCRLPEEGMPAVVIDIAPERRSAEDRGSNHDYEPNDIRILVNSDSDAYWVDSNRLELYTGE